MGGSVRPRDTVAGAIDNTPMTFDRFGGLDDAGALVVCNEDGVESAGGIVLNASGQARLATDDNDSGVINLENDADLGACP